MTTWSATVMLFLILDPFGNTPVMLSLLKNVPPKRRRWIILRENLIALAVLLLFLVAGQPILDVLDIKGPELGIAGGVVIFLISLKMIFPVRGGMFGEEPQDVEPFIVPLAIPLLAGPSAIAVVMLFTTTNAGATPTFNPMIAVFAAWTGSLIILLLASRIAKIFGQRGMIATERLMGMILCVIAVHMILTALEQYFNVTKISG